MAFKNTAAALEIYDRSAAARAQAWQDVETEADVTKAHTADTVALIEVQEAFWQDTKHINSRQNCALADLDFMRRMAKAD